jgi:CRISPR/Cas system-associated protein Cas10 (large subunit of type III CRISPR-Cas system)
MQTILVIQCCICKKVLGTKDGHGVEGISHGYCKECGDKEIEKVRRMKMDTIGDTSKFIDTGLDAPDTATYECTVCHDKKEIVEEYDIFSKHFYPVCFADTLCLKCGGDMERENGI